VYSAIAPFTVLGRSLAAHSNTDVGIAGLPEVPSNATALQLSVTALSGTTTSSMYVYATGSTQPTSANVRWQAGETVTIPVTVAVGTNGDVRLTTDGGVVTVKIAVIGYYSPAPPPGGTAYSEKVLSAGLSTTSTALATVTVPAGTYDLQGKVNADFSEFSGSDWVQCNIKDPATALADLAGAFVGVGSSEQTVSMVALDIDAVQLSSATGNVSS
jgi:hypothetical protein